MILPYFKLALVALLPVLFSAAFFLLERKTGFGRWNRPIRQIIIGLFFGALAVLGTEWGIPLKGAQLNCRDASVLAAGLLFGAPAGVIAGVIGGVERWIAVAWGVGSYTRLACSLSTLIAGIYAALLRKYMFEDKKPGWLLSFAIGVVMEVLHLTLVFLTNMDTPEKAMSVVHAHTVPMILANGLSLMISVVVITLLSGELADMRLDKMRISETIQRWLLVTVILAFISTSYFISVLQNTLAMSTSDTLLELAIEETASDLRSFSDSSGSVSPDDAERAAAGHRVGKTGFLLLLDESGAVIGASSGEVGMITKEETAALLSSEHGVTNKATVGGMLCCCRISSEFGYTLIGVLPDTEAMQLRNIALFVNAFMEILVFAVLFGLIYLLIKRVVVNQIKDINKSLAKITGGDLGVVVNVRSSEEFASLSDDINSTVDTLKQYIAEASARIDKELEFAKEIQSSVLPGTFPAFPKRKDFDIYASMTPAKEVGGDFYDFYITGDGRLHFMIADVSGKGIPAAMFMMRAKTELKTLTEAGQPIDDVFSNGSSALCEGNDAGMFVTAWQGGLSLDTGRVVFANAGHNPPLIRHGNEPFTYLRTRAGLVLAGIEGMRYKAQELQLSPGDVLFLYTDGVTEATDADQQLYGEERLLHAVNTAEFASMNELCDAVHADVNAFVGDAPQFDDITMLALRYIGTPPVPAVSFEHAEQKDFISVTEFLERELEAAGCSPKTVMQTVTAADEVFTNVVSYAYPDGAGPIRITCETDGESRTAVLVFTDQGIPYNPLTREDPDVTLAAEDRQIGGLGIFLVKKLMDEVRYEYRDDSNILTLIKHF